MAATAIALPYTHEFLLPYAGLPAVLPGPWIVLRANAVSAVHIFQNATPAAVQVATGAPSRPTLSVPPGDTLLAVTDLSINKETILVGRIPYAGRRFTTTKWVSAENMGFPPYINAATYDAGDAFLALGGFRGNCGGNLTGSFRVSWGGGSAGVPGFVQYGDAAGIVTQPLGDQRGNIGAAAASILTSGGAIAVLTGNAATSGGCDTGGWRASAHIIIRTEPLEFGARVRSNVSEDAGSLFQATQAAAVELGISEALPYGDQFAAGSLRLFSEALTPGETAVSYYPLPTRNQEMLVTVEGETNLGRMASTYPQRIMRRGIEIPGNVGGEVTPQQAIQYIFDQWASEFPWFVAEHVPDLRLPLPGALTAPRQYYVENPTAGLLTHGAVSIPQEVHPDGRDERQTMREIADEWTAIFPGTVLRQTSRGTIELVPRVGSDAPDTPLLLTWQDLKGISDGEDDPRGVINRARVVVQGWRFEDEQGITAPAFLAIGGMPDAAWPDPPDPNALPDDRERLTDGATQRFVLLTAGDSVLVSWAATEATVEQSGGSWAHFSIRGSDSGEVTLTRAQPTQAVTVNATLFWGVANLNSLNYATTWRFSWDGDVGISVAAGTVGDVYTERILGSTGRTWYLGHLLEFAAFGTAWVRSKESIIGEFGLPGQTLPGPDGTNALTESRALYGERQATINSTQFQLTPEQARQVAEAHVLFNINPRTVRDVQQSEWDLYPIKFDDIGRLVDLPTGERAVVENRSYSDSFSATTGAMQSAFTAAVTEVVIDTATDWLLLDNGDWFQLDTGEMVEAS